MGCQRARLPSPRGAYRVEPYNISRPALVRNGPTDAAAHPHAYVTPRTKEREAAPAQGIAAHRGRWPLTRLSPLHTSIRLVGGLLPRPPKNTCNPGKLFFHQPAEARPAAGADINKLMRAGGVLALCLLRVLSTSAFHASTQIVPGIRQGENFYRRWCCVGTASHTDAAGGPGGGRKTSRMPTPPRIKQTQNWRDASDLSQKFDLENVASEDKKTVAIIGGGLSGLACAKYLADAGHKPILYEARSVLGGKVSAWQDADGDWIETGLHIFFGAYPNMMKLFEELGIEDRLQWKQHQMVFAKADRAGEFTTFQFPPGVPAPFNMAAAILTNTDMLSWEEKIRMVPGLLPMLLEGQSFIDAQDELSVQQFMQQYGMPRRINEEIFIAMGKALDFIDPDKLSMSVILTAMNRFINEADGSQTAFLDGNQPDRLCQPIVEHVLARGGEVVTGKPVVRIDVNQDKTIKCLHFADGSQTSADLYVSAMPVDVLKRLIPAAWSTEPYFRQMDQLEGIPVINVQLWLDRKLGAVDGLCFSRSPLLSVYADMSVCCEEYASDTGSMLELVFAPCSPAAGSGALNESCAVHV